MTTFKRNQMVSCRDYVVRVESGPWPSGSSVFPEHRYLVERMNNRFTFVSSTLMQAMPVPDVGDIVTIEECGVRQFFVRSISESYALLEACNAHGNALDVRGIKRVDWDRMVMTGTTKLLNKAE